MLLALEKVATMAAAETLRDALLAALQDNDAVDIDAGALSEGDFSLVQLLASARNQAVRDDKALRLLPAGQPVLAALFDRAGLLADPADPARDFWLNGGLAQ